MPTLSTKDAESSFGRLIDLARPEPVPVVKHGRPFVVVLSVQKYEGLTALERPACRSFPGVTPQASLASARFGSLDNLVNAR